MAKWFDRFLPPPPKGAKQRPNLPVVQRPPNLPIREYGRPAAPLPPSTKIPNAALVYGIGATLIMVIGLFTIMRGSWGTGLIICLAAACLYAFAFYFVRFTGE